MGKGQSAILTDHYLKKEKKKKKKEGRLVLSTLPLIKCCLLQVSGSKLKIINFTVE